ncbi:type VI secretion system-associated FHA domain protein TagH [Hoeflea ulvae]|uniref:Type VI secretion system-associated FHA domain protein TagH n=1 Tax=Hoeflea ulvae TaxID=2983764 RepID=A0ABT3YH01_9HYPH|nr:type VI secretion system-associated FHA domain protein TagH [Hoeflea ulvae]MCY0095183.1 type VI secretion system-associated FHA domain protein TagH [Hoeflea ulvae]
MKSITLLISNLDRLPDGGPLSYRSEGRAFEIGRDSASDWTLPDPKLFISSRHCDIRFDGQNYILNDISRNGTFLNGAQQRVKSPYTLQPGDKLAIGDYIITVQISDVQQAASGGTSSDAWMSAAPAPAADDDDIWGAATTGPAPVDRSVFKPKRQDQPVHPDFVKSHLDLPPARSAEDPFAPQQARPTPGANPFAPAADPGFPQEPQPIREPGPPPSPRPESRAGSAVGGNDMLAAFKLGARLPSHALANRNSQEVAQELGAMMLLIAEQTALLLKARASAKAMVRTTDRTVIGALDNNPLKFMADPTEALEAMLAKDRSGYLDGMRAFREAFEDIKSHELATYSAMQKALSRLLADMSPESIEAKVEKSAFSNRKAKAWETFVQRWDAKVEAHENGMLDVFLLYFSEAYQEATGTKRK